MADQTKPPTKRKVFKPVVAKADDTSEEAPRDGRPGVRKEIDAFIGIGNMDAFIRPRTKPPTAPTSSAQDISKVTPQITPTPNETVIQKVETTQPLVQVKATQSLAEEDTTQPLAKVESTQSPANTGTEPASEVVISKSAVSVYDEELNYPIGGGQGIIIVNEKFKDAKLNRNGAKKDIQYLKEIYHKLNIDCEYHVHKDIKGYSIPGLINDFSEKIEPDCSVIFVSISTHGEEGGRIMGTDGDCVELSYIIKCFQTKVELLGIPKVFVIQACRGSKEEHQFSNTDSSAVDEPPPQYATKFSDTIICYSTGEGYESFRSSKDGSWFIRILHSCVMNSRYRNLHFVELMTVCCDLAVQESVSELGDKKGKVTETPSYCSTLRKFIRF